MSPGGPRSTRSTGVARTRCSRPRAGVPNRRNSSPAGGRRCEALPIYEPTHASFIACDGSVLPICLPAHLQIFCGFSRSNLSRAIICRRMIRANFIYDMSVHIDRHVGVNFKYLHSPYKIT
ncbi:hypothetical protein FRUB_06635 [Fimbriiglobus ruber]|uniref:Uncharacterized protein n=1 Tax=Fimbriiglobus ruber TaxID=1908690 RepID=A0A225DM39_9BACT|nr:hypothetical protein FRUB_06635 [Fimbriiglobus ruber]